MRKFHYFNPRPPRGGRPWGSDSRKVGADISIHALREEGDEQRDLVPTVFEYFNPRPPRGGRQAPQEADHE